MPTREPDAVDDAGNPIRTIDLEQTRAHMTDSEAGRFLKSLSTAVRKDGGASNRGQLMVTLATVSLLTIWIMARNALPVTTIGVIPTILALIAASAIVSHVIASRWGRHARRGGVARAVTTRGLCGGCGYELADIRPNDAGLVVCPECGAAWAATRVAIARGPEPTWNALGVGKGRSSQQIRLCNDDRGAIFRRMLSLPMSAPAAGRKAWTAEHRLAVRRIRRRSGLWLRVLVSPLALLILVGACVMLLDAIEDGDHGMIVFSLLAPGGLGVGLLVAIWLGDLGVPSARFVRRVRDAGVCPCCATPLPEDRDAEGFLVCVPCRCSWRPQTDG